MFVYNTHTYLQNSHFLLIISSMNLFSIKRRDTFPPKPNNVDLMFQFTHLHYLLLTYKPPHRISILTAETYKPCTTGAVYTMPQGVLHTNPLPLKQEIQQTCRKGDAHLYQLPSSVCDK